MFLNDKCGKGESLQTAKGHSLFVQTSLGNAGFVANFTKSLWEPTKLLVWVGLNWDLVSGLISITDRRISKFIAFIDKFLQSAPYVTARNCASITGHIMSMSPVLDNLTRLETRFLYKVIDSRSTRDSRFNIGLQNDCLSGIFWKNNIASLNSRNIVPYQVPFILSFSDASNVACGAYLVGTEKVSHCMWSSSEAEKSSTWRELKAVHFVLTSFKNSVQGKSVKWHSDNQGAVRIVDIGSPNTELHSIALDIFDFCPNFNVRFVSQWVPRELNTCADDISNIIDFNYYPAVFCPFRSYLGPRYCG